MNQPRETIRKALYSLLVGAYPWVMTEPMVRHFTTIPSGQQPYMSLAKITEHRTPRGYGLGTWVMNYECWIFLQAEPVRSPDAPGETLANKILNGIENTMTPVEGVGQTLGGIVTDCRIEGLIQIVGGILNQQMSIIIPITVLNAVVTGN